MANFKYFITGPHLHTYESSASTNLVSQEEYAARIIDEHYREVIHVVLSPEEVDIFKGIMDSDKNALLYRTHENLGEIAYFKIDKHEKAPIPDGASYP